MSADHTPYKYTMQGIVESWTREKLSQRYGHDFQGAIEALGVKKAVQMMKEEIRRNAECS